MTDNDTLTSAELKHRIAAKMSESLPQTWQVVPHFESRGGSRSSGLVIQIVAPDGRHTRLVVEVKQLVERRDVARLADQLRTMIAEPGDVPVVGSRYLSESVREALVEVGLSYVDATGNMRVESASPALFVSDRGEDRDPWRRGRPLGTLKGEPAARVVRTLLDHRRDWRVRELIKAARTSSGSTYRVLDHLQREDLVVKEDARFKVADWERLLRQWSAEASYLATGRTMAFIEPRGVDHFLAKLADGSTFPAVVTGSVAAHEWAVYAPGKAAHVYVSSIREAADRWELRANTVAPNVILVEPTTVGDVPFLGATVAKAGYRVAAPTQVAADLLNGPGRDPAEGEFLLEWMKANEDQWRRE